MTDERRFLADEILLNEGISNHCAMRLDGSLPELVEKQESQHICKCGGACSCPDCPNCNR